MSLLPPEIKSGRPLDAGELNKVNFSNRHTILTPELLASAARTRAKRVNIPPDQSNSVEAVG